MDTIFNGLSGWGKVGLPGAYACPAKVSLKLIFFLNDSRSITMTN